MLRETKKEEYEKGGWEGMKKMMEGLQNNDGVIKSTRNRERDTNEENEKGRIAK